MFIVCVCSYAMQVMSITTRRRLSGTCSLNLLFYTFTVHNMCYTACLMQVCHLEYEVQKLLIIFDVSQLSRK